MPSSRLVAQLALRNKTWEKVRLLAPAPRSAAHRLFAVHGSLARAGKVKSQTPKVDKQEKKKTPKGRANKRILYNRRCVLLSLRFLNESLMVAADS